MQPFVAGATKGCGSRFMVPMHGGRTKAASHEPRPLGVQPFVPYGTKDCDIGFMAPRRIKTLDVKALHKPASTGRARLRRALTFLAARDSRARRSLALPRAKNGPGSWFQCMATGQRGYPSVPQYPTRNCRRVALMDLRRSPELYGYSAGRVMRVEDLERRRRPCQCARLALT
jgi:hypothetical protein